MTSQVRYIFMRKMKMGNEILEDVFSSDLVLILLAFKDIVLVSDLEFWVGVNEYYTCQLKFCSRFCWPIDHSSRCKLKVTKYLTP